MSEKCGNCKFWRKWKYAINGGTNGNCHKEFPRVVSDRDGYYASVWPDTKPDEWCSEWKAKT